MGFPTDEVKNKINLDGDCIYLNGIRCFIKLKSNKIKVGCTEITPEALKFIFDKWEDHFKKIKEEVTI